MNIRLAVVILFTTVALGCGDGIVIISVNTGTIVSAPFCGAGTGRFDMQNQGGLVILVVINSDTQIFTANGRPGRCTDLGAGAQVRVSGPQQGTQVTARSVRVE